MSENLSELQPGVSRLEKLKFGGGLVLAGAGVVMEATGNAGHPDHNTYLVLGGTAALAVGVIYSLKHRPPDLFIDPEQDV